MTSGSRAKACQAAAQIMSDRRCGNGAAGEAEGQDECVQANAEEDGKTAVLWP